MFTLGSRRDPASVIMEVYAPSRRNRYNGLVKGPFLFFSYFFPGMF